MDINTTVYLGFIIFYTLFFLFFLGFLEYYLYSKLIVSSFKSIIVMLIFHCIYLLVVFNLESILWINISNLVRSEPVIRGVEWVPTLLIHLVGLGIFNIVNLFSALRKSYSPYAIPKNFTFLEILTFIFIIFLPLLIHIISPSHFNIGVNSTLKASSFLPSILKLNN